MEERRQFVRLDTRVDVTYTILPSDRPQRTISKNIGGGGICFFADKPLAPGTRLQVAMRLPGGAEPVNFTAEVVWSEAYEIIGKTERQRSVEVGVKFIEIAPKDRDAVMQHVILSLRSPRA